MANKYLDLDGVAQLWSKVKAQDTVVKEELQVEINKKANASHTHVSANITDLQAKLDAKLNANLKGIANGVASLDASGKVPTAQLPSYVDDVLEFANKAGFPSIGETGKIYVDIATNKVYRWSGTAYVEISSSLALGETSSTAYAGDKGKKNATDIQQLFSLVAEKIDRGEFTNALSDKADVTYVDEEINEIDLRTRALENSLPNKVEKTEFNQSIGNLQEQLNNKSDKSTVDSLKDQIGIKLDVTETQSTGANITDKYHIKFENGIFKIEMTNKESAPIIGEGTKTFELSYKGEAKWNGKKLATIDDVNNITVTSITTEELNKILV